MYFVLCLPSILGLCVFGLAVCKRQRKDEYYSVGEKYDDGWDGEEGWN